MKYLSFFLLLLGCATFTDKANVIKLENKKENNEKEILNNTIKRLRAPMFEDYKCYVSDFHKSNNVDIGSHKTAHEYLTKIREGFKDGPSFAGHYKIAEAGCGTGCCLIWIIDEKTGKITDHMEISEGLDSSFSVKKDSKLFIKFSSLLSQETDRVLSKVEFYILNNKGKLEHIKSITQPEIEKIYPLH